MSQHGMVRLDPRGLMRAATDCIMKFLGLQISKQTVLHHPCCGLKNVQDTNPLLKLWENGTSLKRLMALHYDHLKFR